MSSYKKIVFLFFILFSLSVAFSQPTGDFISKSQNIHIPFTITQYSTKQGLAQNQVSLMTSKKDGTLIIYSNNGIVKYNGYEFSPFIDDEMYLKKIYAQVLWMEDLQVLMGRGTDGTLHSLYPYNYRFTALTRKNDRISTVDFSGDTAFIAYHSGYMAWYNYKQLTKIGSMHTGVRDPNCMLVAPPFIFTGSGWDNGLFKTDLRNKSTKRILTHPGCIIIRKNPYTGEIYVLARTKVFKLRGDEPEEIYNFKFTTWAQYSTDITWDKENRMYISTLEEGILIFDHDSLVMHYDEKAGLPTSSVTSLIYNAREDCLFAGTLEKGLLKFQFKNNFSFTNHIGSKASSMRSVIQTHDGRLLAAEVCCNIQELTHDTLSTPGHFFSSFSMLTEIDSLLFISAFSDGIKVMKNGRLLHHILFPQIPDNTSSAAFEDSKGKIWIGTDNGIAAGHSYKDIKPVLTGEVTGGITCIYETSKGIVCIGGRDGLFLIKENKLVKKIYEKDGLKGTQVRCVYEDKKGRLWVGTYGGGLYCYDHDSLVSINNMRGCMLHKEVFCLVPDKMGYIYSTSNHGLWRFKEQDLDDFYEGRIEYLVPFHYGEHSGILNTEFNGGFQNSFVQTKEGNIYFPSIEGIVKTVPEPLTPVKITPRIDNIYINDTLVQPDEHIFKRNTFSVQFDFSCVNFIKKNNVYFQHKLSGKQSTDWSALKKSRTILFKMLPPGKYVFSVRAIDGFNDPYPIETSFEFEIKPYFYETLSFRVVFVLSFIGIIIMLAMYRVRYLNKKAQAREKNKRQLAEFELKSIQAQMNPHFIFNCLNSIKYFVITEQKQNASKFLDHFSVLIRKFLENSDLIEVPLHEEIIILTEYLELEKMRMNGQFEFSIQVEPGLEDHIIPTMLSQPYVENAVKHAFADIDIKGKIDIRYYIVAGYLVCEVEDNGIGRERALEISAQRRKHISKGIVLVKEKSELLKKLYDKNILIDIIDKHNDEGKPSGTLIIVKIPI